MAHNRSIASRVVENNSSGFCREFSHLAYPRKKRGRRYVLPSMAGKPPSMVMTSDDVS